jgi:hypothetical protein
VIIKSEEIGGLMQIQDVSPRTASAQHDSLDWEGCHPERRLCGVKDLVFNLTLLKKKLPKLLPFGSLSLLDDTYFLSYIMKHNFVVAGHRAKILNIQKCSAGDRSKAGCCFKIINAHGFRAGSAVEEKRARRVAGTE